MSFFDSLPTEDEDAARVDGLTCRDRGLPAHLAPAVGARPCDRGHPVVHLLVEQLSCSPWCSPARTPSAFRWRCDLSTYPPCRTPASTGAASLSVCVRRRLLSRSSVIALFHSEVHRGRPHRPVRPKANWCSLHSIHGLAPSCRSSSWVYRARVRQHVAGFRSPNVFGCPLYHRWRHSLHLRPRMLTDGFRQRFDARTTALRTRSVSAFTLLMLTGSGPWYVPFSSAAYRDLLRGSHLRMQSSAHLLPGWDIDLDPGADHGLKPHRVLGCCPLCY